MVPNRTCPVSVTQICVHIRCLLCVSSYTQNRNVATLFSKNSIYEASRKSVQGELHLQYGQMTGRSDGRTDERTHGQSDGQRKRQMVSRSDGRTDRWAVSRKEERTDVEPSGSYSLGERAWIRKSVFVVYSIFKRKLILNTGGQFEGTMWRKSRST